VEIRTIAIVAAGDLGRRVAHASTLAGYRTILEDISTSTLKQGIAWIAQALGDQASEGEIGVVQRDEALANLSSASSAEVACREADLIIETVFDEIEMKIELFIIFDKFAKPGAVFASTTTSLSITELADVTFCPERCVGMRFFMDALRSGRLELVKGRKTSEETVAACLEVARRLDMRVACIDDEEALPDCSDSARTHETPSRT
jgi:3-hydroxybutyryl-CoA dehydrogenase